MKQRGGYEFDNRDSAEVYHDLQTPETVRSPYPARKTASPSKRIHRRGCV
jgi:hypothetical protein